jgi:ADP-heptose:LPS heptosyltransferase
LLVRLSHLGDVCHALPVWHAARAAHPEAELGWAVQPEFAGLLAGLPGLALFRFERRGGLGAWRNLRRALRAWGPDWAIDCQGNLKSAATMLCSGAPRRIGLHRRDWRERLGAPAVNEPVAPAQGPHALDRMRQLARHIAPSAPLRWDLPLTSAERDAGARELERRLPDRGRPRRILHLAAPGDPRSWPGASFGALACALADSGEDVLLLSGPAEAQLGARLARELSSDGSIVHWPGQRGLPLLAGFFSAAGAAGVRMVVCDSGPCHVAAACGLPVDLLAGPEDPARTGPWPPHDSPGSPHRVHRPPGSTDLALLDPGTLLRALERT